MEGVADALAVRQIARIFSVKTDQAAADLAQFKQSFLPIISPVDDPCPICDLNLEILEPFSQQPSAPYRMDLALTYRCNNRCLHCYNEASRAKNEFTQEQWFTVLDKVWEIGIPHVVFPAATDLAPVCRVVAHASNGHDHRLNTTAHSGG